ncbi:MAG: hypothetical protein V3V31_04180 [Methylococcales bacterium]
MTIRLIALVTLIFWFSFGWAQQGQQMSETSDPKKDLKCLVMTDFYIAHFTAFQEPQNKEDRANIMKAFTPYCQDLPYLAKTYMTVDLLDRDVRKIPVSMRVVEEERDPKTKETREVRVISETQPKANPNGVAEIQAVFDKPGHYAVLVSIGEAMTEDDILRVPLQVGLSNSDDGGIGSYVPFIMLGLLVVLFFGIEPFMKRVRRRDKAERE